ncbi:hypothetical protein [Bradyrhizobium genosp. P]|uniref:hypothetical protein n=1 Tax=Bradyrhizobium genosp. P TaxID=83641 RepID=UPI003CE8EF15
MLGLLIIVIALGIGFGSGYGVREMISRRRRRMARGDLPRAPWQKREGEALVAGPERGDAINLERLLIAANDDLSSRRRDQPRDRRQVDQKVQPDEYDGAVRNLLGELNRRPSAPSSGPHHQTVSPRPEVRPSNR